MTRRISASRLPLLAHCAYTARPDVALPIEAQSPHAAKGSARHALYQWLHEARQRGGDIGPINACELEDPQAHVDRVTAFLRARVPADAMAEVPFAFDPASGMGRALSSKGQRDYTDARPGEFVGTADLVWAEGGVDPIGVVLDWKTGRASHVDPAHTNAQMAFLALVAARAFGHTRMRVVLAFVAEDGSVMTDEAEYSLGALAGVARWIHTLAANQASARPIAGPHCRAKYCSLQGLCPATAPSAAILDAPIDPHDGENPAPLVLTSHSDAAAALSRIFAAEAWAKHMRGLIKAFVDQNGPVDLGGGRHYGPRVQHRESVALTTEAEAYLLTELGPQLFEATCQREATKARLVKAAKSAGHDPEQVLSALRQLGALTSKPVTVYEEVEA